MLYILGKECNNYMRDIMSLCVIAFMYITIAIIVYIFINKLIDDSLEFADEEEIELWSDNKIRFISVALLSLIWIFYIPYLFYSTVQMVRNED